MEERKNFTGRQKSIVLAAVALALAGTVVLTAFSTGSNKTETVYKETTAERGTLTAGISETGIASIQEVKVNFDQTATIEEIYVVTGQKVQKGDPIAKISVSSLQEEMNQKEIELVTAQLDLQKAQNNLTTETLQAQLDRETNLGYATSAQEEYDLEVAQLELDLETASQNLLDAKQKRSYYQKILDGKEINEDKYNNYKELTDDELEDMIDDLDTQIDTLTLKYHQAEINAEQGKKKAELTMRQNLIKSDTADALYENTIAELEAKVQTAQLKVEELQGDIDEAASYLADGIITATSDGTVMSVNYAVGDKIKNTDSLTSSPIAVIGNTDVVYVSVSVDQEDIGSLEIGDPAQVVLSAFEDTYYDAVIYSISTSPAMGGTSTVSYAVTVQLQGDTSGIFNGMSATVTFVSKQVEDVIYVSNRAVTVEDGKSYVKIKDENGEAVKTEVTTGFSDGSNVEIQSGVNEGDIVLIESKVSSK